MYMPAWLLLLWSALGAACAAAAVGAVIRGTAIAPWSLAPAPRSRVHGAAWTVVAGLLAYPAAYGTVFELLHRADFRTGLLLGTVHGLVMFMVAKRRVDARAALRAAAVHLAYGLTIGFLYVTP